MQRRPVFLIMDKQALHKLRSSFFNRLEKAGTISPRSVLEKGDDLWRHATGGKIADFSEGMNMTHNQKMNFLGKDLEGQKAEVKKRFNTNQQSKKLKELEELHDKRRHARYGILGVTAGLTGTHYALKKNKENKQKKVLDSLQSSDQPLPYTMSPMNGGYQPDNN